MLYTNEYLISSNNSINDNKYNAEKLHKSKASYKIKKILKPILRLLKTSKAASKKSDCSFDVSSESQWSSEMDDNSANELLEAKLFSEIENCHEDAAIYVYDDSSCHLQPVQQDQGFVPVHFARTEAGTFFWTTVNRAADCDLVEPLCHSEFQEPQLQYGDRWVQA